MGKVGLMWSEYTRLGSKEYICHYCDKKICSNEGYSGQRKPDKGGTNERLGYIYICYHCGKPTFINDSSKQFPGPKYGNSVEHVPENINQLYNEARNCIGVNAYTASVICCRKLLMNIAVEKGDKEGRRFIDYVDFIVSKNLVPPDSSEWVDIIRKKGNDANHEIKISSEEDATDLVEFLEMLLKFIYEFPGKANAKIKKKNTIVSGSGARGST